MTDPDWWPDDPRRQFIIVSGTAVALVWGVRAVIALERAGILP